MMLKKNILILGAQGMAGHTIYKFLSQSHNAYGTQRTPHTTNYHFFFDAEKENIDILINKKNFEYIINCIGILPNDKYAKNMKYINGLFPHKLARVAQKKNIKIFHISTDGVFNKLSGEVNEDTLPIPDDVYGQTKLLGECRRDNVINIRTSIIGLERIKKKGLLQWALKQEKIYGYENQYWAGCTTIQIAKLFDTVIKDGTFDRLREKSNIYHFIPLNNTNKYLLLRSFMKIYGKEKIVTLAKGSYITRKLLTKYDFFSNLKGDTKNLEEALQELITFEQI